MKNIFKRKNKKKIIISDELAKKIVEEFLKENVIIKNGTKIIN